MSVASMGLIAAQNADSRFHELNVESTLANQLDTPRTTTQHSAGVALID
jgi:hypothetical protein